jgi:hypothetical protein
MSGARPLAAVDGQYVLVGLAWCGLCGLALEPAPISPGKRFYGCRSIHCPRPVVPAELLETLVWQAFRYLFVEPGVELSDDEQRQALAHSLEQVTVGEDLGDIRYQWRDAR